MCDITMTDEGLPIVLEQSGIVVVVIAPASFNRVWPVSLSNVYSVLFNKRVLPRSLKQVTHYIYDGNYISRSMFNIKHLLQQVAVFFV